MLHGCPRLMPGGQAYSVEKKLASRGAPCHGRDDEGSRWACRPMGARAFSSAQAHCPLRARAAIVQPSVVCAPFLPVAFSLFERCVPCITCCGVHVLEMVTPEADVLKPVDPSITDSDDWQIFILNDARVVYESNGKLASLLSAYADTPLRVEGRLEAPDRNQTKYCMSMHMALPQLLTACSNQETI
jgi:hypothetical protein